MLDADHLKSAAVHTGEEVASAVEIGGGRNSRVWKISTAGGKFFALKRYAPGHDIRLKTEWRALSFLQKYAQSWAPAPVAFDLNLNQAVYEYIDGQAPVIHAGSAQAMEPMVRFAGLLAALGQGEDARSLPMAAESALDLTLLTQNLQARAAKLYEAAQVSGPFSGRLNEFMRQCFTPAFERRKPNISALESPPMAVLSPSDFGFHNAVREPGGRVRFLDFEYFGWDDPAKLIIDVILHPHEYMNLSPEQKKRWMEAMLYTYGDPYLKKRVENLLPILGLKWSLIVLNEFLAAGAQRRTHAGLSINDETYTRQIAKARRMLAVSASLAEALRSQAG